MPRHTHPPGLAATPTLHLHLFVVFGPKVPRGNFVAFP